MSKARFPANVQVGLVLVAMGPTLTECSGSTLTPTTPTVTVPAAAIQANGEGALVLHPSLDTRFAVAMETPIRVRETAGGTATWDFARLSLIRNGLEIERSELGSNVISAAGLARITANGNDLRKLTFRFNSGDFTQANITLGFVDAKDGRVFTVDVPFLFSDVTISFTPLSVPANRVE